MGYQKGVTKIELNEYKAVWAMKSACKYSILYLSNFFVASLQSIFTHRDELCCISVRASGDALCV